MASVSLGLHLTHKVDIITTLQRVIEIDVIDVMQIFHTSFRDLTSDECVQTCEF